MKNQTQTHPIATMETSIEFKEACNKHGFETFEELLNISVDDLDGKYGFSKHNLMEFVRVAQMLGIEEEIRE